MLENLELSKDSIKIAFIKDPHLRFGFNRPQGRNGAFETQILEKINFIENYCEHHIVDSLVFTGDVLDKKAPSDYSPNQLMMNESIINDLNNIVDTYTIHGNHDLPFSSIQMKDKSILNYYMKHGAISPLPCVHGSVKVYGIDYKESIDENIKDLEQLHDLMNPDDYNIVVIHQHFAPQIANNDELSHSSFKRYSSLYHLYKINSFVFGHLHIGFPTETIINDVSKKQQHFINPWSMTRLSRSYYSVNEKHIPEMVILNIDTKTNTSTVEHVILPHAPYSEAFIVEEMKLNQEFNENLHMFVQSLTNSSSTENMEAPEKIRDRVNDYLERAKNKE